MAESRSYDRQGHPEELGEASHHVDHTAGHSSYCPIQGLLLRCQVLAVCSVKSLHRCYTNHVDLLRLSTFPLVWEGVYKLKKGTASLNYLSLGVGFVIGLQICAPCIDRVRAFFAVRLLVITDRRSRSTVPLKLGTILQDGRNSASRSCYPAPFSRELVSSSTDSLPSRRFTG